MEFSREEAFRLFQGWWKRNTPLTLTLGTITPKGQNLSDNCGQPDFFQQADVYHGPG